MDAEFTAFYSNFRLVRRGAIIGHLGSAKENQLRSAVSLSGALTTSIGGIKCSETATNRE